MTCTSDRVLDNIIWRLETLTSHTDTDRTYKDFIYYDEDKLSGEVTSGMTRGFSVDWVGSSADSDVTDTITQAYAHDVMLTVAYYRHADWRALQRLILRDRFDIVKLLRNDENWSGYAESPSADLGIGARYLLGDEIQKREHAVYLVQRWRNTLLEDE